MNERIKEFRFKAAEYANEQKPLGLMKWNELRDAKFAELIVRECIQLMDNEYSKAWNNGVDASSDKFVNGINKSMKVVKEHFGVE